MVVLSYNKDNTIFFEENFYSLSKAKEFLSLQI